MPPEPVYKNKLLVARGIYHNLFCRFSFVNSSSRCRRFSFRWRLQQALLLYRLLTRQNDDNLRKLSVKIFNDGFLPPLVVFFFRKGTPLFLPFFCCVFSFSLLSLDAHWITSHKNRPLWTLQPEVSSAVVFSWGISVIKQHTTRTTLKKRFPHLVTSSSIVIPQARKFLHKHSLFSRKYRCFQRRFLVEAPWRVQQVSPAFRKAPHWHLKPYPNRKPEKSRTPECT